MERGKNIFFVLPKVGGMGPLQRNQRKWWRYYCSSLLTTSSTISTSSVADIRLHYINSRENCAWEITDWWRGEQFSKRKNIYLWLLSNMISLFNLLVIIIMVKLRRKMGKVNVNENWYFFEKYLFGKSFFPPAILFPTQLLHINKSIYNTLPTLRVLSREQPI